MIDMCMDKQTQRHIQTVIGYEFRNPKTLATAFTHASFAQEHGVESNRRLEFLGDAVLNFLSARAIFFTDKNADEGKLTKTRQSLVSKEPLAKAVRRLGLLDALRVGKNENTDSFNDKSVSDLYEAVVGAIYYDSGELLPCEMFFHRTVYANAEQACDSISAFKEWAEQNPHEDVKTVSGQKSGEFYHTLLCCGTSFSGTGRTKKDAEREACRKACGFLNLT